MPSPSINGVVGTDGVIPNQHRINLIVNAPLDYNLPAVYQIHNPTTDEIYIGATGHFSNRLKQHLYGLKADRHENKFLQKSANNTDRLEITVFPVNTIEVAFQIEKELIKENKGKDYFLNIKDSQPAPMTGKHHSDETKEKISKHHKDMYVNGYTNPFTGKEHSKENKLKQSNLAKKLWEDPIFRENKTLSQIEIMKNPTNRELSRQGAIKQWEDPDSRNNLMEKRKEQFDNLEFRKYLSDRQTERMQNPQLVELSRQGAIKQWEDPIFREKRCKKTIINGIEYESLAEALRKTGIPNVTYYRNLKKGINYA